MTIPQIQSAVKNVVLILTIAPAASVGLAFFNGDLRDWLALGKALEHGFFGAVCMGLGWIGMASPWAHQFRTMITSLRAEDGQEMKVALSTPAVETGGTSTVTMDPVTAKVTIKEEPAPQETKVESVAKP